jgi:hypothetical protein
VKTLLATAAAALLLAAPKPAELDKLLAPVALYPDALLSQMLLSLENPGKVGTLSEWMNGKTALKGTELQDAAKAAGFTESFAALTLFPDVVHWMAGQPEWMAALGKAFAENRSAVFDSIQRLRTKARDAGKLKTTPQQKVETQTTSSGQQVIVIEPSNPQVVYVPTYDATTVYTSSTVVVQESSSSSADAALAGMIGFTAGIAIGAAFDNDYYYGPYGWGGGFHMYNDAWDDWYDHREDAREDWMDHREDIVEERSDAVRNSQEQRTERQENRVENRPETQAARQQSRESRSSAATTSTRSSTASTSTRSGTGGDAFSNYSSGKSERAASQRGSSSRSSSRSSRGSGGSGGRRR